MVVYVGIAAERRAVHGIHRWLLIFRTKELSLTDKFFIGRAWKELRFLDNPIPQLPLHQNSPLP